MDYIPVNTEFVDVVAIPESTSSDTVSFKVYKASDGSIFAQGNAVFVGGVNWKVTFTPTTLNEVYSIDVKDETLDVIHSNSFKAVTLTSLSQPVNDDNTDEPTAADLLTEVNKAIKKRIAGDAVQSYSIGGRNLQYMSIDQLYNIREKLRMEVNASKGPARNVGGFRKNQTGVRNWQDLYEC